MRLAHHMVGFSLLVLAFLLGRLIVQQSRSWSEVLSSRSASRATLGKWFTGTGRTVEVIAAIWGLLEAVAVLILAT